MIAYSDGAYFKYVPCTKSNGTTLDTEVKGQVRSKIHRTVLSHVAKSPSVQDNAHQRLDRGAARHVLPQETHFRLEQACRRALQKLVEGVKQEQEKNDCLLLELKAT